MNAMNLFRKQLPSSILGLALDGNHLEAVEVRRSGEALLVREFVSTPLALSPLGGDPALVGREIRNHLDQAGVRERRCAVCIPVNWVLSLQTKLPDLPEADLESFLQIEAERGFTSGHENLFIVNSRWQTAGGEKFATLLAVPRNHLETLENALKAAQLKPVTFVLGLAALEGAGREPSAGTLAVALGGNSVELGVAAGGGIAALRSLDGAIETTGSQKHVDAELVAREIRITLGQLPAALAEGMRGVKVFARGELARQFINDLSPRLQNMGLRLESMDRASAAAFVAPPPPEIVLSPALAAAANCVRSVASGPELLPPKINQLQEWMTTNVAFKKLGWVGVAGAAVVLLVGGAFLVQGLQAAHWNSELQSVDRQAKEVRDAQDQIARYGAWFDQSAGGLGILKALAEAFPLDGSVTAKTVDIRNLTEVTCSGIARDSLAYRGVIEKLGANKGVSEVTTDSLRGSSPSVQFTFKFQWEGDTGGN
jgi:hypothetical protein